MSRVQAGSRAAWPTTTAGTCQGGAIRVAIGGQVPHFAVRFRWHPLGLVNKSQGAVVPARTPSTWPASNHSRTSSARPWIDPTTTERLNFRHLCPDVLRKGWGQSPAIGRRIGAPAFRDAGHLEQAHQGHTHSRTGRSDHVPFNIAAQEQRWSEQLTVYSRSWPEAAGAERHIRHPTPMAGGGVFPVDPDVVRRGPGRRAHLHGSGQLARIRTPSGVSPRLATPGSGRRSLNSAVPRGIQVFGVSRRIRGALRAFS